MLLIEIFIVQTACHWAYQLWQSTRPLRRATYEVILLQPSSIWFNNCWSHMGVEPGLPRTWAVNSTTGQEFLPIKYFFQTYMKRFNLVEVRVAQMCITLIALWTCARIHSSIASHLSRFIYKQRSFLVQCLGWNSVRSLVRIPKYAWIFVNI